jgi:RNA polymerase sigma-70 factor (ECF subfamily)
MDTTLYTDEELVSLSLNNKRYFAEIVRRYELKLSAYIYRLAKLGPEDAEDLLQEVFLKVYQNLNSFDAELKFSSWIYRITHNETMAFFRRRNVRPHGHLVDESEEVLARLASELDLMRDLEAKDDTRILIESLNILPKDYREVLILKYFEHKSYDEISDILTMPSGTVATRINRAKERLRRIMSSTGYNHD